MIKEEKATFAGGCFWCMLPPFRIEGVIGVQAGYAGGSTKNPTYEEVSSGATGHVEAVQVTYDLNKVSFKKLLDIFWHQIDPTDGKGQFADQGSQYRTIIFYHNEEQKKQAQQSKEELELKQFKGKKIATEIIPYKNFFQAERHHQDYDKKNPLKYKIYKTASGREAYLKNIWKKK
ncbi:MAG: peptide-methionine (S)-S-oxide reductase MsrA [Patescibacteria group bacterium]